jgi:ankyrin repeat protein
MVHKLNKANVEVVEMLLNFGAIPEPKNNILHTPLHLASMQANGTTTINVLLQKGCNVDAADIKGMTVLSSY